MGYFSRLSLAVQERASREPEGLSKSEQLQNRIDDLRDRLDDFARAFTRADRNPPFRTIPDRRLSKSELRYVLPNDLLSYEEVLMALTVAEDELRRLNRRYVSSVAVFIPGQVFIRPAFSR